MSDSSFVFPSSEETPDTAGQSFSEVTELLDVAPGTLRRWIQRFGAYLESRDTDSGRHFSPSEVETLTVVRGLLTEGNTYEQITQRLQALHATEAPISGRGGGQLIDGTSGSGQLPQAAKEVVQTLTDTQRSILNSQGAIRDLLGVVVQDNFNLKEENRKIRERMLELERTLAEYQRREETRKERLESRLRALEGTLGALQQQVATWVQMQRQRRRGWFW